MTQSIFGWRLPPGVTTLPGEDEPDTRRCEVCEEDVYWEDAISVNDTTTDGEAYLCIECAKTNLL